MQSICILIHGNSEKGIEIFMALSLRTYCCLLRAHYILRDSCKQVENEIERMLSRAQVEPKYGRVGRGRIDFTETTSLKSTWTG